MVSTEIRRTVDAISICYLFSISASNKSIWKMKHLEKREAKWPRNGSNVNRDHLMLTWDAKCFDLFKCFTNLPTYIEDLLVR